MEMGFHSCNFKRLFECLDYDGKETVSICQLRFLEVWQVDEQEAEMPPTASEQLLVALEKHRPLDEVCELVSRGGDPNLEPQAPGSAAVRHRGTALIQAAERGTALHLQSLLACRADPNIPDAYGRSPLHRVAARGAECRGLDPTLLVQVLCVAKADLQARMPDNTTALHVACSMGNPLVAATLCHLRADPNVRDDSARSCMFFAVNRDDVPCCKVLLRALADPCRDDKDDSTAIAYAIEHRRDEIYALMREHVQENCATLLPAALDELYARRANLEAQETVAAYVLLAEASPQAVASTIAAWQRKLPGGQPCEWPEANDDAEALLQWPVAAPPSYQRRRGALLTVERRAKQSCASIHAYLHPAPWDLVVSNRRFEVELGGERPLGTVANPWQRSKWTDS